MEHTFPFRFRGKLWLFGGIFFLYLFSTSRERPWGDATPIWEVADSIANAHTLHARTRWPVTLANGKDGHLYGIAPLLQSLIHVPGAYLHRKITNQFPDHWQISWRFMSHLASAALGTWTCVLFFGLCRRRLGVGPIASAATTLALAFASSVWVYARYPYSEALQLFCFTGFFAKMLDVRERPSVLNAVLFGVWTGFLVNAKPVFAITAVGGGLFLIWELRRNWRSLLMVAGVSLASAFPLGALYLYYNYLRWGSIYFTGYGVNLGSTGLSVASGTVRPVPLVGLWGMFLSPGKSIFLYSPPLLLSLIASLRFAKRFRAIVLAMLLTVLPFLYIHAQTFTWSGDYAWGPRYTVFALAVFMLPAALFVDECLAIVGVWARAWRIAGLAAVFLGGVYVTYLGNAVYWDHFIRINAEAYKDWLGEPNNRGDGASSGKNQCSTCFEALYALHWLPPFQHILGNAWLLEHLKTGDDWMTAEGDAPWRRYTNLQLNIRETYARARIDWWFIEYRRDMPTLSWTLAIVLPLSSLVLLALFLFELRRAMLALRARALHETDATLLATY
jgi:hypothetical protein